MNNQLILGLLLLFPIGASSQVKDIRILPEFGLSKPSGDFKKVKTFANDGIQMGLNVDVMFGKFGLGLYGGMNKNDIKFDDFLPPNTQGLIVSNSAKGSQFKWRQLLLSIGGVFKLDISEKFNVELTSLHEDQSKWSRCLPNNADCYKSLAVRNSAVSCLRYSKSIAARAFTSDQS